MNHFINIHASTSTSFPLLQLRTFVLAVVGLFVLSACQTTVVLGTHHALNTVKSGTSTPSTEEKSTTPIVRPPIIDASSALQSAWPRYNWAQRGMKPIHIGVILPLHGRYAAYGRTLLNGIRLAVSSPDWGHMVQLTVIDAADSPAIAAQGYEKLVAGGVNWVIGPLLRDNVQAIIPHLRDNIPVISLSKHSEFAAAHPALFIHSIARGIQASFMAREAIRSKMTRIAIITGKNASEQDEARTFAQAFTQAGGEIAATLTLDNNNVNYINRLRSFRAVTDDEVVLRDLDIGLRIFTPLRRLDIRIPPGVDALYLAMPGAMVAKLAGQLAYVDLRKIPMLGSNRWMDKHLLDDSGRYLTASQFCQPVVPSDASRLVTHYRETWGQGRPSALFALGYDTAHILLLLGSRLGLQGARAIQALHDGAGFPAESGKVYFNAQGVAEKNFDVFIIRDAKILLNQSQG